MTHPLIEKYRGWSQRHLDPDPIASPAKARKVNPVGKLDRTTAKIGTHGYLPPLNSYELDGDEDWEEQRKPFAILDDDRHWVTLNNRPGEQPITCSDDLLMFATSEEAIRYAMLHQLKSSVAQIQEAQQDIDSALAILERLDSEE